MLAAVWDTPYNVVYLVHLLSIVLGVGMAFLAPVLTVRARREGNEVVMAFVDSAASAVVFPALLVTGTAGGALVGMSSDFYDFQQTWLAIGGAVWMLTLALAAAVYPPSWLKVVTVGPELQQRLGAVLHLSLAFMLVLMTWKFGSPI